MCIYIYKLFLNCVSLKIDSGVPYPSERLIKEIA